MVEKNKNSSNSSAPSEDPEDSAMVDKEFSIPEAPPLAERSMELPAVIIGDRGAERTAPEERLLPGRLPESVVLYPAYALSLSAGILVAHWSLSTGELNPVMALLAFALLFSWHWVYGVSYRYRRYMMKLIALVMITLTGTSLVFLMALRSLALYVPGDGGLELRSAQPSLSLAALLTALSVAGIFSHVLFLGRGYRKKKLPVLEKENDS